MITLHVKRAIRRVRRHRHYRAARATKPVVAPQPRKGAWWRLPINVLLALSMLAQPTLTVAVHARQHGIVTLDPGHQLDAPAPTRGLYAPARRNLTLLYVDTDVSPGGDGSPGNPYATLAECLGPFVGTTLSAPLQINCSGATADPGTGGGFSTDHSAWDFYTSPTNYVEIIGDNPRPQWNTNYYRISVTNRAAIYNNFAAHVRVYNLQGEVKCTGGGAYDVFRLATANNDTTNGAGFHLWKNCITRKEPTSTSGSCFGFIDSVLGSAGGAGVSTGTCTRVNCVAIDCDQGGFNTDNSTGHATYNCTAYSCTYGFIDNGKTVNCLGTSCSFGFIGTFAAGSDYNAEDDGNGIGGGGTHNRSATTFSFLNAAGGDFRLVSSDAGAKGFGVTDPSGSGLYADDGAGTTRPASWSIGAFEVVVPTAALTGTATASIAEADIVAGGKTIIVTLTDDTFVAATGTPTYSTGTTKGTAAADSAGGGGGRTGDGTLTCTFPSGYTPVAGHFALMILYSDQGSGSTPTGWSAVTGSPFGSGTEKLDLFYKVLAGGESDPVTTISGSAANMSHCANMAIYTGVGSIGAIGTASAGTGTPMTAGAVTTTANGSIVVACSGRGDNENASGQTFGGSSTGVNERLDGGTAAGNDSQVSMADITIATSGSSSGAASSTTSATDPWVSVQVELKPSTPFNSARQAFINGFDGDGSGTAWDAEVKAKAAVSEVVRTSSTVVTWTIGAQAGYDISSLETITGIIPASILTGGSAITASPTFTIATSGGGAAARPILSGRLVGRGLLRQGLVR